MRIFEPVDFDSYMTGTGWRGRLAQAIRERTPYKAAAEYHVRCVRAGYPACWLAELLTGLMVEKPPTELRPGLAQSELMSPRAHWPIFWASVMKSEDGWSELNALMNAGYEVHLSSHSQGRWWYSMREGSLVCRSADREEQHSLESLRARLEAMNADRQHWAGVFVFQRWKQPGREHILGHDGAVLNWILTCIDELTRLYRLCVPVDFPFPERPEHLVPVDTFVADAFWDKLRRVGDRDGRRGDKYCSTARGLLEAFRDVEEEFYGFDCGWEPEQDAFAGYLKGQLLLRVGSDGSVLVRLGALPEQERSRARTGFEERFACPPDAPKLCVMHFARFSLPEDMRDWITLVGKSTLAPRQ